MNVRIIFGRAGSGKSSLCKNEILNQVCDSDINGPLSRECGEGLLIVPEQFGYMAEYDLVNSSKNLGILDAEVLSFTRLAYKLSSEVAGRTRRKLTKNGKSMLIYRTFLQNREKFKVFTLASNKPGFVNVVADLISEFKRYNHSPLQLRELTEKLQGDSLLKRKMFDISTLYELYHEKIESNVFDTEDMLDLLIQNIAKSDYIKNCSIWIDEFFGFTGQEMKIIEQLMIFSRQVTISLCMDKIPESEPEVIDLFAPTKNTCLKIIKSCRNIEVVPEFVFCEEPKRFLKSEEILHLERNLFSLKPNFYPGEVKDISIVKAGNIFSEIEIVAQKIVNLVKEEGLQFSEIAVVSGAIETYNGLISAVFTSYDLPFFMDEKTVISLNPLVRFLVSALKVTSDGWKYRDVFSYLRTGLSGVLEEKIDILEEYVIANNIQGSAWTVEEIWEYRINGYFSQQPNEEECAQMNMVDEIRREIAAPLQKMKNALIYGKSAHEVVRNIYQFLMDLDVQGKITELQQTLIRDGYEEKANEYYQTWNLIIEILDQIEEAFDDEKLTIAQVLELIEVAAVGTSAGSVPLNMNRMFIGDVTRSRTHAVKVMFIVGVNEGVFPASGQPEGLLSDVDRETLYKNGMGIAPTVKQTIFDNQILVYSVLATASEMLYLSYSMADGQGKGLRPSGLIAKIKKVFPKVTIETEIQADFNSRTSAFNRVIHALRSVENDEIVDDKTREAYRWFISNKEYAFQIGKLQQSLDYDGSVDYISPEKAIQLYGTEIKSSVSKMEKFAQCPFSFFIQYGLKAKLRQQFDFEPKDEGTLSHEILEKYFKEIANNKIDLKLFARGDSDGLVDQIMDSIILSENVNKSFASNSKYLFMLERIRDTLKTSAWFNSLNLSVGKFTPKFFELKFGNDTDLEPIRMDLGNCTMSFTGFIDRVDVFEENGNCFIKVVDYKTGPKEFKLKDVYNGVQLQLISYLIVLKDGLGELVGATCLPGAVFYQQVRNPIIVAAPGVTDEQISSAIRSELKPSGLVTNNQNVLFALDDTDDPVSQAVNIKYTDGVPSGKHLAELHQVEALQAHALKKLEEFGRQMAQGNTGVLPVKDGDRTACDWCVFKKICLFNGQFKGCRYRKNPKFKNDKEIWDLITAEVTGKVTGEGETNVN